MKITLIAMGDRMDSWVETGFLSYQKRLPSNFSLTLKAIPLLNRSPKMPIAPLLEAEGRSMLEAVPRNDKIIALDAKGKSFESSEAMAKQWEQFLKEGFNISLLIGSPEGFSPECLKQAHQRWSLSPLTFPHPLVRLFVAEAIYRSWCIIHHHPYHK